MRVHLGSDHTGFAFKAVLSAHLTAAGYDVVDHGADKFDPDYDYVGFAITAAQATVKDPGSLGIVLGSTGAGEVIAANKVNGVRAALIWDIDTAKLARRNNDANVASIGVRSHDQATGLKLATTFLQTGFVASVRNERRIAQIAEYEARGDTWNVQHH
ncbi:MAG: RpiB/LacA/LacB family sugar-phosphate isomerase [Actinomycetes bacterium]